KKETHLHVVTATLESPEVFVGLHARFLGHGMSVNRERPVAVVNARNSFPSVASESNSMISLRRSSISDGAAGAAILNVEAGGGLVVGSKLKLRSTHRRFIIMFWTSPGLLPRFRWSLSFIHSNQQLPAKA